MMVFGLLWSKITGIYIYIRKKIQNLHDRSLPTLPQKRGEIFYELSSFVDSWDNMACWNWWSFSPLLL